MKIDPAGWPFIGGALALAVIVAFAVNPVVSLVLLVLAGFFLFFFRDPDRLVTQAARAVLSPADGRVMVAGAPTGQEVSGRELAADQHLFVSDGRAR